MDRDGASREFELVGRSTELDDLESWIRLGRERTVIVTGAPGVGKTTLWEAAVATAARSGIRVLTARAAEAETAFPFATLADVLDGIDLADLRGIPAPQRRAVEVAILRAAPDAGPHEPQVVGMGLLAVLRLLVRTQPVLLAIDDVQWADRESIDALGFALRRVGDDVRLLLTRRSGHPDPLAEVHGPLQTHSLGLEGLSLGAMRRLLDTRLNLILPRRLATHLHETTLGNPLFALEVGRALAAGAMPAGGEELPLPQSLDDLLWARASAVQGAGDALLAVALGGGMSGVELASLVGQAAVDAATAAGLLVDEQDRLRLWHPLLATTVVRRSSSAARRALHRRLASATADPVRRARHLALSATDPDPILANRMADGARAAAARGAIVPATELAEHALRLTPAGDADRDARILFLGDLLNHGEDGRRLRELMDEEFDHLSPGANRAHGHLLCAHVARSQEDYDEQLAGAVRESADAPRLRALALAAQSVDLTVAYLMRLDEAERKGSEALSIAPDSESRSEAVHALGWSLILRGRSIDHLRAFVTDARGGVDPASSLARVQGIRSEFRGELEAARSIFRRQLTLAQEQGHEEAEAQFGLHLAEVELRAGRLAEVEVLMAAKDSRDERTFRIGTRSVDARVRAVAAALRGDPDATEDHAARAVALVYGQRWDLLEVHRARGIAALAARQLPRARDELAAVWRHTESEGIHDPGAFPVAADLVEAALGAGDEPLAREVSERLSERAADQQHPWGLASAQRCHALLALAGGADGPGARDDLLEAVASYDRLGCLFDAARTLLALGIHARRLRKWGDARSALTDAAGRFDGLGSTGWAVIARAQLSGVGGRRPATPAGLTPTEQRVAELARSGLSNKEIAATLFVGVHTVEVHLARVYSKLGLRSRSQLQRALADPAREPSDLGSFN